MQTVSFTPTPDDLLAAYRLNVRTTWKSGRMVRAYLIGGGVVGVIAAGCALAWELAPVATAAVTGFVYWVVALTGIVLATYLRLPRQVRRIFDQQKSLHRETTVTWTQAHITFESSQGQTRHDWADFLMIVQSRNVVILRQSEALMNFIPTRVLNAAQIETIVHRGTVPPAP